MTYAPVLSAAAIALAITAGAAWAPRGAQDVGLHANAVASTTAPALGNAARIALPPGQVRQAMIAGELDRKIESLLTVDHPMRHGEFLWNEASVPDGPVWIRVDLARQLISVFRAGHEIGTAVILYGANEKATPSGRFKIQWKRKDHHSGTYDAPMPYTLRLTDDGISIHGSDVAWGRATHGCIAIPNEFARRLFEETAAGDEVVIVA